MGAILGTIAKSRGDVGISGAGVSTVFLCVGFPRIHLTGGLGVSSVGNNHSSV